MDDVRGRSHRTKWPGTIHTRMSCNLPLDHPHTINITLSPNLRTQISHLTCVVRGARGWGEAYPRALHTVWVCSMFYWKLGGGDMEWKRLFINNDTMYNVPPAGMCRVCVGVWVCVGVPPTQQQETDKAGTWRSDIHGPAECHIWQGYLALYGWHRHERLSHSGTSVHLSISILISISPSCPRTTHSVAEC